MKKNNKKIEKFLKNQNQEQRSEKHDNIKKKTKNHRFMIFFMKFV